MSVVNTVVRGALKIDNVPDRACFSTWRQFLESIPDFLTVEVPSSVSGVVVGPNTPDEDDRDKIWFRRDNGGNFLGVWAFQNGAWRPLFNFGTNQIIWTFGDSTNIPDGFVLIEEGDPVIPSNIVQGLTALYIPAQAGPGFGYYALRFSGY